MHSTSHSPHQTWDTLHTYQRLGMWCSLGRTARRSSNLFKVLTSMPPGDLLPLESKWTTLISLREFAHYSEGSRPNTAERSADERKNQVPSSLKEVTKRDLERRKVHSSAFCTFQASLFSFGDLIWRAAVVKTLL
jgi:hypothetical protein